MFPAVPPSSNSGRWAFDVLDTAALQLATDRVQLRMCGRVHDGRRLLFDLAADEAGAPVPTRLTQATVESVASSAGPGAGLFDGSSDQSTCEHRARWQVQGDQGQFAFDAARLFIHEDFSRQAATIIPPRDVPFGKRLAWQLAFALLATSFGRRWLARRAR